MECLSNGRYIVIMSCNMYNIHVIRWRPFGIALCTPAMSYYNLFKVFSTDMSFTGPLSRQTQCEWRPVSNNSEQDQCDTVWSTTRRNILRCGHIISCARIYCNILTVVFSRLFMPKGLKIMFTHSLQCLVPVLPPDQQWCATDGCLTGLIIITVY